MSDPKSCNGCINALFQDEGYSNYTVENTAFLCMKRLHPEAPFDRFYGEDKRLDFAEKCSGFEAGDPIVLDVDGEAREGLGPSEKERLDAFEKSGG